mgnify:CR=1 FL=1
MASVDVLIGAQHHARDSIAAVCASRGYRLHVQSAHVAALMGAADLAIGAGGTTMWERCCLGLPAVTIAIAPNQQPGITAAALRGLVYAPDGDSTTAERLAVHVRALAGAPLMRQMLSRNGMAAVDGAGVDRVCRRLDPGGVRMREATRDDAASMLEWRNHESIRLRAKDPKPIGAAEHRAWLEAILADRQRILLIGERDGHAVGVIRFDIVDDGAEVSIYVVPGTAEPGLGTSVLLAGEAWLKTCRPEVRTIQADVLEDNEPSHGLFRATGYSRWATRYQKVIGRA